ncbi:MAG TPA: hypothetical protein CFH84_09205 [Sulfurimonas sp. UBA12504]|nr:MAG: hypothetical protein A2019_04805 [Sulfurimonas sp. GWF2_37_8]DAB29507.1 MAG TPA: hypothetical protein CFH84_09205 [Sulfurimonas sp. UBA12504]
MQKKIFSFIVLSNSLFCSDIFVEVENLQNECKILKIGLYNSKESFPTIDKAYKNLDLKVLSSKINHTFLNIPNGTYAIALFCDENQNSLLDKNFIGIPKEAFGFSNNPKVFRKPNFEDAKFELNNNKNLKIEVQK